MNAAPIPMLVVRNTDRVVESLADILPRLLEQYGMSPANPTTPREPRPQVQVEREMVA